MTDTWMTTTVDHNIPKRTFEELALPACCKVVPTPRVILSAGTTPVMTAPSSVSERA